MKHPECNVAKPGQPPSESRLQGPPNPFSFSFQAPSTASIVVGKLEQIRCRRRRRHSRNEITERRQRGRGERHLAGVISSATRVTPHITSSTKSFFGLTTTVPQSLFPTTRVTCKVILRVPPQDKWTSRYDVRIGGGHGKVDIVKEVA